MSEVFTIVFPGLMITWILFIAPHNFSDLYTEFRNKTLQRLLVSTATLFQIVVSKAIRCFLVCLIAKALLILVSWLFFGMKWGNLAILLFIILCVNLCITGVIAFIYGISDSSRKADVIIPIFVMSMAFVSGAMVPYNELPKSIQQVGDWSFIRWGINAIHMNIENKPFWDILRPCLG
ncbi:hypothetical protein GF373_08865, partial [bacterium]|nr:hypothetical protein [bacterium]